MSNNEHFLEIRIPLKHDPQWADWAQNMRTAIKTAGIPVKWQWRFHHHMTILFLDDDHCVDELTQGFDRLVTSLSAFPITIDKLDAFTTGNGDEHIIYMTATQVPSQITTLAQEARTLADGLNANYDKRPFKPHVTLGRVSADKASLDQLQAALRGGIQVPAFNCMLTEAEHRYRDHANVMKRKIIKSWALNTHKAVP